MTESLLWLFCLSFALGGCFAAFAATRAANAWILAACATFPVLMASWVAYGYGVTHDFPTTVAKGLGHVVLYGVGLLVFGGLPFATAFFCFVSIIVARRKRRSRQ